MHQEYNSDGAMWVLPWYSTNSSMQGDSEHCVKSPLRRRGGLPALLLVDAPQSDI
jgi:hypothetical protein